MNNNKEEPIFALSLSRNPGILPLLFCLPPILPRLTVVLLLKFLIEEGYILISGTLGNFRHRKRCLFQQVGGGLQLLCLDQLNISHTGIFLKKPSDIVRADMEKVSDGFLCTSPEIPFNITQHRNHDTVM